MVNLSKIISLSQLSAPFILLLGWTAGNIFSLRVADTITIRPLDVGLALVWFVAILKGGVRKKIQLPIYFFVVAGFSLLANSPQLAKNEFLTAFAYWYRWAIYAFSSYAFALVISRSKTQILLILLPLVTAVTGIGQYILLPDVRFLFNSGWDDHYYRAISHLLDPGFTAAVVGVGFLFMICAGKIHQPVHKISLAVLFVSMLLTYSRAGYLSIVVGILYWGWIAKKKIRSALILILLLVGVILLPRPAGEGVRLERTASVSARFVSWSNAVSIIKDNTIFGIGFNAYRYAQRDRNMLDMKNWEFNHAGAGVDSSLLFVMATTGLLGIVAFGHWLINIWKHLGIFRPVAAALLVHSIFLNSFFYPFVLILISLIISYTSQQTITEYSAPPARKS